MKLLHFFLASLLFWACEATPPPPSAHNENWGKRSYNGRLEDSTFTKGSTYLPIYSQIYTQTAKMTHDLTATVSIRNIHSTDSVYIIKAAYFDTSGKLIRSYFEQPIFIRPLETVEIVIDEKDRSGGTGANFVFDWVIKKNSSEPFFEGVMISTAGQSGISFTTKGIKR